MPSGATVAAAHPTKVLAVRLLSRSLDAHHVNPVALVGDVTVRWARAQTVCRCDAQCRMNKSFNVDAERPEKCHKWERNLNNLLTICAHLVNTAEYQTLPDEWWWWRSECVGAFAKQVLCEYLLAIRWATAPSVMDTNNERVDYLRVSLCRSACKCTHTCIFGRPHEKKVNDERAKKTCSEWGMVNGGRPERHNVDIVTSSRSFWPIKHRTFQIIKFNCELVMVVHSTSSSCDNERRQHSQILQDTLNPRTHTHSTFLCLLISVECRQCDCIRSVRNMTCEAIKGSAATADCASEKKNKVCFRFFLWRMEISALEMWTERSICSLSIAKSACRINWN